MKHYLKRGILLFVVVACIAAAAQTGGLTVMVSDSIGPLPGATVTISHETGFVKPTNVKTDVKGIVVFPALRPGLGYVIEVSMPGGSHGSQRIDGIRVVAGDDTLIPVVLAEAMVESVRVIAEGSVVQLESTQMSTRFSEEYVRDLPVPGRFYQNVITLAPGVQDADGDGNPNTESYNAIEVRGFRAVVSAPLSTFSIDVDTASYSNVRRLLNAGQLPPPGAVRIEELINYFDYAYPQPEGDLPFGLDVEIGSAPWNPAHRLARIGLKGREISAGQRPPCNLVFLIDVSGSMQSPEKLPLVRDSLRMLVGELNTRDQVSIVVYAGAAGLVLPPTSAADRTTIFAALAGLQAGGSTAGSAGIQLAYQQARSAFIPGGVNRIVLATDGDFNVGISDQSSLIRKVETEASTGVELTTLGFGMGNYKDSMLEQLANHGNGNHAYIDSLPEARKVLVEESAGTLVTIAKDVKIQVEFNPARVAQYRLIGYENRALRDEDFNDDKKDAGEIGAGHTVTALYELIPPDIGDAAPAVDALKYQRSEALTKTDNSGELLTVKVRWKAPASAASRKLELAVSDLGHTLAASSSDLRFAAAVASFGMLMRESNDVGDVTYDDVLALASTSLGTDPYGHRNAFLDLVTRARNVERQTAKRASR